MVVRLGDLGRQVHERVRVVRMLRIEITRRQKFRVQCALIHLCDCADTERLGVKLDKDVGKGSVEGVFEHALRVRERVRLAVGVQSAEASAERRGEEVGS